jgi:NAD-dependent dihydropyrimidine dehydrogenase PreA subunit
MGRKTKIIIDYTKCGDGVGVDPRDCAKCLQICEPALFLMHETLDVKDDPYDPQLWRVTALYPSLCTKCMKCVEICPEHAIKVK